MGNTATQCTWDQRISINQAAIYLCSGYIREDNDSNIYFPSDLYQMISQYINNILYRFNQRLLNPNNMAIVGFGKKVELIDRTIGPYGYGGSALIDLAIDVNDDECKYEWKIRIDAKLESLNNYHYFIGVASNRAKNFEYSAHAGLQDAYGTRHGNYGVVKFRNKEIICIQYDGKLKQLKYINDETEEELGVVKLPPNISAITHWYPAVSLRDNKDTAEIIT